MYLIPSKAICLNILTRLFLLYLFTLNLSAQKLVIDTISNPPEYHMRFLNGKNGLLQNDISDLHLSPEGLLWIATQQGLVRYSGRNIVVFTSENEPKLFFDRALGFHRFPGGEVLIRGAGHTNVWKVRLSDDERTLDTFEPLKDYTWGHHGIVVPYKDFGFQEMPVPFFYMPSPEELYHDYLQDSLEFNSCLYYYHEAEEPKRLALSRTPYSLHHTFSLSGSTFVIEPNGIVLSLVGTSIDTLGYSSLLKTDESWREQSNEHSFLWKASDTLAYLFRHGKLYQLDVEFPGSLTLKLIAKDLPNYQYSVIQKSHYSSELFLGTRRNGLLILSPKVLTQVFNEGSCAIGLSNENLAEIGKDSVLTNKGALFTKEGLDCGDLYRSFNSIIYAESNPNKKVLVRKQYRPELYELDLETYRTNPVKADFSWDTAFPRCGIRVDTSLYLFVSNRGFCKWTKNGLKLVTPLSDEDLREVSFPSRIFNLGDSVLWMPYGYKSSYLKYYLNSGKYELVRVSETEEFEIRSCFKLKEYELITTYGHGLFYRRENQAWEKLELSDYPAFKAAHSTLELGEQLLWTTNQGLFLSDKEALLSFLRGELPRFQFYAFGSREGLDYLEFNNGRFLEMESGSLVMPNLACISVLRPDFKEDLTRPQPFIFIDNITYNERDSLLDFRVPLDPRFERINLRLENAFYGDPKNAMVFYRIPEISEEWYPVDFEKGISFDRLPSSEEYSLELFRPGASSELRFQTLINFSVGPRFHETSLFYVLVLVGLIIMVSLIVWVQQLRNNAQKKKLGEIIRERTADLASKNVSLLNTVDELEYSREKLESEILMRNRMIQVFSHDIRGPLRFMSDIASSIYKKVPQISEAELLSTSSKSAYDTANSILDWIKAETYSDRLQKKSISESLAKVISRKQSEMEVYKIRLETSIQQEFYVMASSKILEIIFDNLIQNAIKFCSREIRIKVKEFAKGVVCISVADDGEGISNPKKLKRLNEGVSVASSKGYRGEQGTGLGLMMVRELVLQMEGKLNLKNSNFGFEVILLLNTVESE